LKALDFKDVADTKMEVITIYTVAGLLCDVRINLDTLPKGLHGYNTRHDDEGNWCTPVTIEKGGVAVNFCGVFLTAEEMVIDEQGFDLIEEDDLNYEGFEATPRRYFAGLKL